MNISLASVLPPYSSAPNVCTRSNTFSVATEMVTSTTIDRGADVRDDDPAERLAVRRAVDLRRLGQLGGHRLDRGGEHDRREAGLDPDHHDDHHQRELANPPVGGEVQRSEPDPAEDDVHEPDGAVSDGCWYIRPPDDGCTDERDRRRQEHQRLGERLTADLVDGVGVPRPISVAAIGATTVHRIVFQNASWRASLVNTQRKCAKLFHSRPGRLCRPPASVMGTQPCFVRPRPKSRDETAVLRIGTDEADAQQHDRRKQEQERLPLLAALAWCPVDDEQQGADHREEGYDHQQREADLACC